MRRLLLLVTVVGLIAAAIIATSFAARRPPAPRGSRAVAQVSLPQSIHAAAPAPRQVPAAPRNATPAAAAIGAVAGSSSLILVVDPETGQPVMPESQLHRALTITELQALARSEAQGLVTIRNADGSETLNHEGRFADHSIVRVGPDGKPIFVCVEGEGELEHALHGPLPVTPTVEGQ